MINYSRLTLSLLALGTIFICFNPETKAEPPLNTELAPTQNLSWQLLKQGQKYYLDGQFDFAARTWQKAAAIAESNSDVINQAKALSNLALAYQKLGKWQDAYEAGNSSTSLAMNSGELPRINLLRGQVLNNQASLLMEQGKLEEALVALESASKYYQQGKDPLGLIRSELNRARVLQLKGEVQQAEQILICPPEPNSNCIKTILESLPSPDPALKANLLLQTGEVAEFLGKKEIAQQNFQDSLAIARDSGLSRETTFALIALADFIRTDETSTEDAILDAVNYYQEAADTAVATTLKIKALVNLFTLLLEDSTQGAFEIGVITGKIQNSNEYSILLQETEALIRNSLKSLPVSREAIYAQINFARSLFDLQAQGNNFASSQSHQIASISNDITLNTNNNQEIVALLADSISKARNIGDIRAESQAFGTLGKLYEAQKQLKEAAKTTEQALLLSKAIDAPDITYQWQWQLGRIFQEENQPEQALKSYREAYNTLQTIRSGLAVVNPEARFSFRREVEPVYRGLVSLLLNSFPSQTGIIATRRSTNSDQNNIIEAREVIESLQVAELVNFFRVDCDVVKSAKIEEIDRQAAVIYPIILDNTLEIIVSVPGDESLRHYSTNIDKDTLESTINNLTATITSPNSTDYLQYSQKIYSWLFEALEADLPQTEIATLTFILDGKLRNIPMGVLHDGEQYLIEKYAIALTPGLQLVEPRPFAGRSLKALVGALTEGVAGYDPLPSVEEEVATIEAKLPDSNVLQDASFTNENFNRQIREFSSPIVHLATHGEFGSTPEETFIITYDQKINANQLTELLRNRTEESGSPIEMLIFSACQTAEGDDLAALGLAGVAIRSGARSTIGTLWKVSDKGTANFMNLLYNELDTSNASRAEILRQSQIKALQEGEFQHPFYWSPFVLVGNWL
ncbi:MAG: CHAT domain-containing protein [Xenococcaceae cyanobacterium MO_167.B27]|nr:CHAT domain-containing protein [Xenococcaceae cyanobacterium MO_167.B27]